ncbi:hypothetical protein NL676_030798 [Syzygium grande]|nr:hypothetical protein NL676_030798 [Syzygium grande]
MQNYVLSTLALSLASLFMYCVGRGYYVYWHRPKTLEKYLRKQGLEGTSYSPFHDDLKQMAKSPEEARPEPASLDHRIVQRVRPFLQQMVHKYGKVCLTWIETRPRLIVADPELIKVVLADKNGHFVKPPSNPLLDLLQLGVSTLEGEKWAKRRKLIIPAFHFEKLKGDDTCFSMSCCALMDRLKELTDSRGSYEEGKKIFELQKEQAVLVLEAYFSLYLPGFSLLPTKKNKRRYYLDQQIKSMIRKIIRRKEKAMQNGESCTDDLLSLLLQRRGADSDMTIEDVVEECKLIYFAGQETTANWLTWTMVVLSMHPEWQEKAREEVLKVCGDRIPNIDEINRLKIVSMILHEVMRLYPPVTALYRHTCKNTTLGGMSIPAGVDILLPTLLLHFDPKLWGDDADEFRPERFANGISNASKHQLAFNPFGWGPRICPGQNFSTIEAKMALAMILQNFQFQLSPAYVHAPHTVITLQPQHGAPMILHRVQPFRSL